MYTSDVAIIGAGPYGLSAAAHLSTLKGMDVRVFGEPMDFWASKMPAGMLLRSPREASSIADPESAYTLESFEAASATAPASPLPLKTFVEYGRWFQKQLGTIVDTRTVCRTSRENGYFSLMLQDGTAVRTRRLVVAAGVGPFHRKPRVFANLAPEHVSHCYEGREVSQFAGKRVAIIGAGQSALESAALLHEAGSKVEIIARIRRLRWIGTHKWLHQLGPISKMLYSKHDIGPIGISRLVAYPQLMTLVPLPLRDKIRKRAVRSAGSRWLPVRLTSVSISTGRYVTAAVEKGGEVQLSLNDGCQRTVDHILLGTGYDVDISRYNFLDPEILGAIRRLDGYPEVGSGLSTSVPGLHFTGAPAARRFGPLMYFVTGTEFASRELRSYILRNKKAAA